MSTRTLAVLIILGLVAVAGGWYFGPGSVSGVHKSVYAGRLMFPDLAPKLQSTARIEVIHGGKTLTIARVGDHWGLVDRGGYPVQEAKLRSMLTALTELRLVEPRTAERSQYGALGVENATSHGATSHLLRVLDGAGHVTAALIVGHRRARTAGQAPVQVYVRRPGDNQSWLAEGSLQVDGDPQVWLDRDIMNIDHSRIAKVMVTDPSGTLAFDRSGKDFALVAPAEHPKLDSYKVQDVARALELLTFDDVRPSDFAPGVAIATAVFTTEDGLSVTATAFPWPDAPPPATGDANIAVRFTVTGTGKAKPEAVRLAALVKGWTYGLGAWKKTSLLPALRDLAEPPPSAPAEVKP